MSARSLPSSVWALGLTSMLMDVASEMVHGLLPVFLVTVLRADIVTIGWIEGLAESVASVSKVFSGALSDRLGRRKPIALFGYGLAVLSKIAFPLAPTVGWVAAAHSMDRFGKGIRGAPRDALVADLTPAEKRGAAYGLRQSLDSVGSLTGPAFAVVLMWYFNDDVRTVLWLAPLPALAAVITMTLWVKEPARGDAPITGRPLSLHNLSRFDGRYWGIVLLGAVFTLARFSEAFLVLRARDTGLRVGLVPFVLVVMNVVYMLAAYPAGTTTDRRGPRGLLLGGLAVLITADLVLARADSIWIVMAGAALWGLHMALTQGTLAKLVSDTVPTDLRGTGFGVFNLVTGISTLFASLIAGALWSSWGPAATFLAGAGFAGIAAIGLMAYSYRSNSN